MPDVRDSFSKVAANYSKSTFHASSVRLQEVVDLVRPKQGDLALDVATGTGNTAFALAPRVRRVVGLDLTRERRDEARRVAAERTITNLDWVIGDASHLPFQDDTFDIYVVRAAPHHFTDVEAFLAEAFRVLKPDRDAAFVDCAPPLPARDVLHDVELRRDPRDILSLAVEEWLAKLERARSTRSIRGSSSTMTSSAVLKASWSPPSSAPASWPSVRPSPSRSPAAAGRPSRSIPRTSVRS